MANVASSGNLALLVSDFQALASETKRKHADVKEAADKALTLLRTNPQQVLTSLRQRSDTSLTYADDIIKPIFMGCGTKNVKVVAIALGSLQRLIGMDVIPPAKIPQIVAILTSVLPLGVEIQLRILQTLPSLFTRCSLHLHENLLADALLLCFRLQDSRIGVVSSTSAATLRQLVMVVFEGVAEEDQAVKTAISTDVALDPIRKETDFVVSIPAFEKLNDADQAETTEARRVILRPSAKDAYLVFEDLCLLVNGDSPSFLKLQSLPKTFGLELIESVMTGHSVLFQQHPELIFVLRAQLCPLLIRALSEKPTFALTLRLMRVAFLLLKQFCDDLLVEAEVFLSLLIKTVSIDHSDNQSDPGPLWLRVLALEIFRGLCADFALLMRIYERYDRRGQDRASGIFTAMMSTLNRLASEKPLLLGINHDLTSGASFTHQSGTGVNAGVQGMIDGVVGMATQAAAPLVGTQQQNGLTLATASMKLQCIDQLDKAEAPPIPETYVYLLSLQCLSNIAEGFAGFSLIKYEDIRRKIPPQSSDGTVWAAAALDFENLNPSPDAEKLKIVRSMADASWPALLASLSFFVSTNLDEALFGETLSSMQSFTFACGVLNLPTPRDAFLLTFCKFAVPPAVVANIAAESSGGATLKPSQSVLSADTLGIGSNPAPTSLSARSFAFLRTVLAVAQYLAGSLGNTWYTVFDTLQNADFVLSTRHKKRSVSTSASIQTTGLTNTDTDELSIQNSIQRLFDCSRTLSAPAFTSFIASLCRLSSEMVGLISEDELGNLSDLPKTPTSGTRRRASGMNASRTVRQSERSFCITKLGAVALLNISRVVNEEPSLGWSPITSHLLAVQRYDEAPSNIRLQAADVLDQILLATPNNIIETDESHRRRIQSQIINTVSRQTEPEARPQSSTDLEVRKLGFDALFKILENNGHALIAGWLSILDVLRTACPSPLALEINSLGENSYHQISVTPSKHTTAKLSTMIRTSFPSLQLICTDFLTALDLEELRQCISVLTEFGRQTEDINIALTAGGLLWQVSDHVQVKNKALVTKDDSYVRLWMYLLSKLLQLGRASRQEVRDGAIQTLFRTIGLYGTLLSQTVWHELLWEVIFPLINLLSQSIKHVSSEDNPKDHLNSEVARQPNGSPITLAAKQLDDSKILVLESTGKVLFDHMSSHIVKTPKFLESWSALIEHLQSSFMSDRPSVGTVAMKTMSLILSADLRSVDDTETITAAMELAWDSAVRMSKAIAMAPDQSTPKGIYFTQVSLEAYIMVMHPLQTSPLLTMSLERVQTLLNVCKVVVTYAHSPDYRPDIDTLPPLQVAVLSALDDIVLEPSGVPSALLIFLSELSDLAFTSSFSVSDPLSNRPNSTQVSYVAMCKAAYPRLVGLHGKFHSVSEVYTSSATSRIFRSLSVPMKLKYKCPSPHKYGKASPLWKTATLTFLSIIRSCLSSFVRLESEIDSTAFVGVWEQLVETYATGLLADCECAQLFELDEQRAEENFDLALIATLELEVLPHLSASRIPDEVIQALARALQQASRLYDLHLPNVSSTSDTSTLTSAHPSSRTKSSTAKTGYVLDFAIQAKDHVFGTFADTIMSSRERFAYWCFDLLFLYCQKTEAEEESGRRRVASLCLPVLLDRCSAAIKTYVADASLRGRVPFPRVRDEEVVYILQKLLDMPLWEGSLTAGHSKGPSLPLSDFDRSSSSSGHVGSILARGADAHLMYLQPLFIDLLSLDISSHLSGQGYSACRDFDAQHQHYKPYRDLLQANDCTGAGLEGRWPSLALGRVGVTQNPDLIVREDDLKQLALMCLRRTQALTAVVV